MNIGKIGELFVTGFFIAVVAATIFVKAGAQGGATGGQQSAQIINAGGDALSNVATGLEG